MVKHALVGKEDCVLPRRAMVKCKWWWGTRHTKPHKSCLGSLVHIRNLDCYGGCAPSWTAVTWILHSASTNCSLVWASSSSISRSWFLSVSFSSSVSSSEIPLAELVPFTLPSLLKKSRQRSQSSTFCWSKHRKWKDPKDSTLSSTLPQCLVSIRKVRLPWESVRKLLRRLPGWCSRPNVDCEEFWGKRRKAHIQGPSLTGHTEILSNWEREDMVVCACSGEPW